MRGLNRSRSNKFVIFLLLCFLIGFSVSKNGHANAQLPPLPPPAPQPTSIPPHLEPSQFKNDTSSPIVEVLTTSLVEGANVFKVKITDESPIDIAQVIFVQNGQFVTEGLVKDPNNIYKILMYAHLPSAVVITRAVDVHGKATSVVKYLNVIPLPKSILEQITNFFANIGKSIVSVFRSTKQ